MLFSGISTASNLARTQGRPLLTRGMFFFRQMRSSGASTSVRSDPLLGKIEAMPITRQQALDYFHSPDLIGLGFEADAVRRRLHPEGVVTYIIDRNINYTNFCTEYCTFCAFYRPLPRTGKPDPAPTRATSSTSKRSTRRSPRPWRWAAPAC